MKILSFPFPERKAQIIYKEIYSYGNAYNDLEELKKIMKEKYLQRHQVLKINICTLKMNCSDHFSMFNQRSET